MHDILLIIAKLFFLPFALTLAKVNNADSDTNIFIKSNNTAEEGTRDALRNITNKHIPTNVTPLAELGEWGESNSEIDYMPNRMNGSDMFPLGDIVVSSNFKDVHKTTERAVNRTIVAYVAGDICDDRPKSIGCPETAKLISKETSSDFVVLPLGDLAYESGTISEFNQYYHPYWGQFKNRTYPVLGNHEKLNGNVGYFQYFGIFGNRNTSPGKPDEGYYSFDLGSSWHFVALNTNVWTSNQREWLIDDLRQNTRPCILAYGHNPRYSPGKYGKYGSSGVPKRMFEIFNILVEHNVDIYMAGHDHIYSRYAKQDGSGNAFEKGTAHFLVGTGGKNMQPISNVQMENLESWYTPRQNQVSGLGPFGLVRLVLGDGSYDFSFLTTDGSFRDEGTARCNVA